MERRNFVKGCFNCSIAAMIGDFLLQSEPAYSQEKKSAEQKKPKKNELVQQVNQEQIIRLLKFIEKNVDKPTSRKIFYKLGYECFHSRNLDKWIKGYKPDIDRFFDWVNSGNSRYWEKLEYDKENSRIKVTAKKFSSCVCAYAQCPEPPKSLCHYCCKALQVELFEALLDKKVEVKIDSAILLGDERCCTTIYVKT
ncbi:MAG: hypothetical protein PVJ60_07515 [Phycisphaerales bacterium]|jgi:hypothetical protein